MCVCVRVCVSQVSSSCVIVEMNCNSVLLQTWKLMHLMLLLLFLSVWLPIDDNDDDDDGNCNALSGCFRTFLSCHLFCWCMEDGLGSIVERTSYHYCVDMTLFICLCYWPGNVLSMIFFSDPIISVIFSYLISLVK